MKSRKGFAMVEAAIIYPLIIGAVMATIYIIICMYTGTAMKANINTELRSKVLEITETGEKMAPTGKFMPGDKYGDGAFSQKVDIYEASDFGTRFLYGSAAHTYRGNGMMQGSIRRSHEGTVYLIDERDYIRKVDMISK